MWSQINGALSKGFRSLPGGSSLTKLLAEHRGKRNSQALPSLSVDQILSWADTHRVRTGEWPMVTSGPVHDVPGESWVAINSALSKGGRGLPGNSTLAKLLDEHRGRRNPLDLLHYLYIKY